MTVGPRLCCVCREADLLFLGSGPDPQGREKGLDVSTHPFTGGAGPSDVRMTTRYSDNWAEGFGATIHETGHALWPTWRNNVALLVQGMEENGNTALHIACDSDEQIRAAFARVAAMMSGMSEAL